MPKSPNHRTWIVLSLLFIGAYLLLGSRPANATQLLDVRIGEYDRYTRIVFEADGPSNAPNIDILHKRKLKIAFDRTDVSLVRKIPVERSRHIQSLQFWQSNDQLMAVLLVDYPHYRFETFTLSNPPRIVVDIFPMAPPASEDTSQGTTKRLVPSQPGTPLPEEDSARQLTEQDIAGPEQTAELPAEKTEVVEERPPIVTARDTPKLPRRKMRPADSFKELPVTPSRRNSQATFRLQFFLVIGLVVITIGILFLLLMMLFARHRFSEVKTKLSTGDVLRQQDQKIEVLNSRIEEQFERYDKA